MITQLYPATGDSAERKGIYLAHRLHEKRSDGQPYIYTNFISSADGRVSLTNAAGEADMPAMIENSYDWWLFQELAAQADAIIVSSIHMRRIILGEGREITYWDLLEYHELGVWREENGFPHYPTVIVINRKLDIEIPDVYLQNNRRVLVLTLDSADEARRVKLEAQGVEVVGCGSAEFDASKLPQFLLNAVIALCIPQSAHMDCMRCLRRGLCSDYI